MLECRVCSQTTLRADQVCVSTNSLNTPNTAADRAVYVPPSQSESYEESHPEHSSRNEHKPNQPSTSKSEAPKEQNKQQRTTNHQDLQEETSTNLTSLAIKSWTPHTRTFHALRLRALAPLVNTAEAAVSRSAGCRPACQVG